MDSEGINAAAVLFFCKHCCHIGSHEVNMIFPSVTNRTNLCPFLITLGWSELDRNWNIRVKIQSDQSLWMSIFWHVPLKEFVLFKVMINEENK